MADYTRGKRLHTGYSFELLGDDFSAGHIRRTGEALQARMTDGWPCRAISNHDVKRVLTRWGGDSPSPALAKLLTVLVTSLRGTACIYQGEAQLLAASMPASCSRRFSAMRRSMRC
jgi:alpha-glucosidase